MRTRDRKLGWIRLAGFTLLILKPGENGTREFRGPLITLLILAVLASCALAVLRL